MIPAHTCTHSKTPEGVVVVDGRKYPMASSVVATEDTIQRSIRAMAERIAREYMPLTHKDTANPLSMDEAPISYENPLVILSVLKGSYIFTADFVRYLGDAGVPHVVDFIRLSSYNAGTSSTGVVNVLSSPKFSNFAGKHMLILEDVCDSGRTLKFLKDKIVSQWKPKSVRTVVLANKEPAARRVVYEPEYACMTTPNEYIIGYGFEVNDRYRDFRHIFVLKDGEDKRYPAKL